MKFNRYVFFGTSLGALVGTSQVDAGRIIWADPEFAIQDSWIVVFKAQEVSSSITNRNLKGEPVYTEAEANALAASYGADVQSYYANAVNGFSAKMSEKSAAYMSEDPAVEYIEQDAEIFLDEEWGLDRSDQEDLPLDNTYTPIGSGAGVAAYIVDTGIRITHVDFGGRARYGTTTYPGQEDTDCNGHGTHVAGTVGGTSYGIAKEVELIGVKVFACSGSTATSYIVSGCEWVIDDAAANGKPATANLSIGGGTSTSLDNAVASLQSAGIVTAVSAGNSNTNACNQSPAREPSVITVGSTTSSDERSSFSNYGTCVDIFAPGSSIRSCGISSDTATATLSGTSMASPHVCGGAAVLLGNGVNPTDVTDALIATASQDNVANAGFGSPNLLLWLRELGPTPEPTTPPPTFAPTPCISETVEVTLTTDFWPQESYWTLVDDCSGETVASVSAGYYSSPYTTYVDEYCVDDVPYTFTMYDTYGDGSGEYTVTYNGNDVIDSSGDFGSSEANSFNEDACCGGDCGTTLLDADFRNSLLYVQSQFNPRSLASKGMWDVDPTDSSVSLVKLFGQRGRNLLRSKGYVDTNGYAEIKVTFGTYITTPNSNGIRLKYRFGVTGALNNLALKNTPKNQWTEYEATLTVPSSSTLFYFAFQQRGPSSASAYVSGVKIEGLGAVSGVASSLEYDTLYEDDFEDSSTYSDYNPEDLASRVVENPDGSGSSTIVLSKAQAIVMKEYKDCFGLDKVVFNLDVWAEGSSDDEGLKLEVQFKESEWKTFKTWTVGNSDLSVGAWSTLSYEVEVSSSEMRYRFKATGDETSDMIYIDGYEIEAVPYILE